MNPEIHQTYMFVNAPAIMAYDKSERKHKISRNRYLYATHFSRFMFLNSIITSIGSLVHWCLLFKTGLDLTPSEGFVFSVWFVSALVSVFIWLDVGYDWSFWWNDSVNGRSAHSGHADKDLEIGRLTYAPKSCDCIQPEIPVENFFRTTNLRDRTLFLTEAQAAGFEKSLTMVVTGITASYFPMYLFLFLMTLALEICPFLDQGKPPISRWCSCGTYSDQMGSDAVQSDVASAISSLGTNNMGNFVLYRACRIWKRKARRIDRVCSI